jgi:undecaprenyl-diphosphatase
MHRPSVFPDRHPRLPLIRIGGFALLCAALFAALLALVQSGWSPLIRLDHGWVDPLHDYARQHTAWTASMETLTNIGGPVTMRSLLGLAAIWLWSLGARVLAGWAAAAALVGWLVSAVTKAAIARPRPYFADPVAHAPGGSFPSGHAMASAITCAALVALFWPRAGLAGRAASSGLAVLIVLAVGWSRIALGVHWPTDVLAGWLAAGVVLGGVTVAIELWRPGALSRDIRQVDWRTRPRVQRVLVSGEAATPEEAAHPGDADRP